MEGKEENEGRERKEVGGLGASLHLKEGLLAR